jgi:hypothetical protein
MHYIVSYSLTGKRTEKKTAKLMALFAERGNNDSTVAHWVYADGGGGFLITDGTEMDQMYKDALAYAPWMDFSARPIISIDEAVPEIVAWLNS